MTLDDLSALLGSWPKSDHHSEPTELWLMTSEGLSNPAKVVRLNGGDLLVVREDDPCPAAEPFARAIPPETPPELA